MSYTLISSVGTGMYKDDEFGKGYRKTTYDFQNGRQFETRLFLEAIMKAKYKDISRVILVGTETSSWGALVDEGMDENLWLELIGDVRVTENSELAEKIMRHLYKRFSVNFILKIHTDEIDFDTAEHIFEIYKNIVPEIKSDDILFDITHGFRSMPLLVYQALQFSVQDKNVELIYGEYNAEKKLSFVRNLSPYWKYAQTNNAISLFREKLDGFLLADLLESDWNASAKVIKKISSIVQTNFSLQIVEILHNIGNVLKRSEVQNEKPWFIEIRRILEELKSLLDEKSISKTLYKYANYLQSKNLNTQAVIALQVCVETAITEKFAGEKQIGDYEWWQTYGETEWKKSIESRKELREDLNRLRNFRNQIAHGGGKNKNTGNFPSAENMTSIFERCKKAVRKYLELLDGEELQWFSEQEMVNV